MCIVHYAYQVRRSIHRANAKNRNTRIFERFRRRNRREKSTDRDNEEDLDFLMEEFQREKKRKTNLSEEKSRSSGPHTSFTLQFQLDLITFVMESNRRRNENRWFVFWWIVWPKCSKCICSDYCWRAWSLIILRRVYRVSDISMHRTKHLEFGVWISPPVYWR